MATQFIVNEKGERTAVVISPADYEDLLHQHQIRLELTDEYKAMIDGMLIQEDNGQAKYTSVDEIRNRFDKR